MNTCIATRLCTVAPIGARWTASASSTLGAEPEPGFSQAARHHQKKRWSEACGHFAVLANRGDPDAARTALFMHRYGRQLYGSVWEASPGELESWAQLSARSSGRSPLDYQLAD
jgi:hypothetical protein